MKLRFWAWHQTCGAYKEIWRFSEIAVTANAGSYTTFTTCARCSLHNTTQFSHIPFRVFLQFQTHLFLIFLELKAGIIY